MVNGHVGVLPKKRWPATRKCPESSEPPIDERRGKDPAVGMVVKVDANIYPRDPTENARRSYDEGRSGPWAGDAGKLGVLVKPECACESNEAPDMEDYTVSVLRMSKNAPTAQRRRAIALISTHKYLIAAPSARAVITKLTQGPQRTEPTMRVIAKKGQNDLAKTSPACDRNLHVVISVDPHWEM